MEDGQAALALLRKLELESLQKIRDSEEALSRQLNSWQHAEKKNAIDNKRQSS